MLIVIFQLLAFLLTAFRLLWNCNWEWCYNPWPFPVLHVSVLSLLLVSPRPLFLSSAGLMLFFRLNLVFNGPIFFEPLVCVGLMIFLLLISHPVPCNASFTKTWRSLVLEMASCGIEGGRAGHVGHRFPCMHSGINWQPWPVTHGWRRLNLLTLMLWQKGN